MAAPKGVVFLCTGAKVFVVETYVAPMDGYVSLSIGDSVEVQYVGSGETDDRGWAYGENLRTGVSGWFPAESTCGERSKPVAQQQSALPESG